MLPTWHPLSTKVDTKFVDKRRSLGQYSSLADSGHGVLVYMEIFVYSVPLTLIMPFEILSKNMLWYRLLQIVDLWIVSSYNVARRYQWAWFYGLFDDTACNSDYEALNGWTSDWTLIGKDMERRSCGLFNGVITRRSWG
jgi:hypothetical protein